MAELSETLQGGIAVLDEAWCLTYVSDRFLHSLWGPGQLHGADLRQLLPALVTADPRHLQHEIDRGSRVEFEQQFLGPNDEPRWFRITVLPLPGLGANLKAVVFAKDITPTSRALAQLRDATLAITHIENGLRRRLSREVHDGPIQLLAALMIRVGLLEEDEATRHLQSTIAGVASELRSAVAAFSEAESQVSAGSLLRQWISPCLVDTQIEVEIRDQRRCRSALAEVQAAFVFLYQTVRAARFVGGKRKIGITLRDENHGIRVLVTINSSSADALEFGRVAAQYRAVIDHARALGGTLSNSIDGSGVRLLSMWIPTGERSSTPDRAPSAVRPEPGERDAKTPSTRTTGALPPLDDAMWLAIASAAPERIVEHDAHGRFSFVNDVQMDMLGRSADELIGSSMFSVFSGASTAELGPTFERLLQGEVVDFRWLRGNAFGESRLVRVTTSPRLDEDGQLVGTLSSVDDLSDVHFLDDLYESALTDLSIARRLVTERTLLRLRPSIEACAELVHQLENFTSAESDPGAFGPIARELGRAVIDVRRSVNTLESPDVVVGDLGEAVRAAVRSVITGTELRFIDTSSGCLANQNGAALLRIAREAVVNAVTHGGADHITMELRDENDGLALDIHDNGVGIKPGDLDQGPSHLGTRSMRERARERGGICEIEPASSGGTVVRVWLPNSVDRSSLLDPALLAS